MNALDQIYGLANTVARQAFQIEQLEQKLAEAEKDRDQHKADTNGQVTNGAVLSPRL